MNEPASNSALSHACTPHSAYITLVKNQQDFPETIPPNNVRHEETMYPSHIFIGSIVTMDDSLPRAEALAIKNGNIVAVGSATDIEALAGPTTERINLGSHVLYPGLIESHMHVWVTAINYDWIDCSAFVNKSLEDIKEKIVNAAAHAKPGEWILGKLFDPSLMSDNSTLTTKDLDPLTPNNPVFIFNASMHFAYVNSKTLELCGITNDTPDPVGGKFERYSDGKLNGCLSEMSTFLPIMKHIDTITPDTIAKNVCRITNDAASVGVTCMREAATGSLFGMKEITLLHTLQQQGNLKTRISIGLYDDAVKAWTKSPDTEYMAGDEYVWIGARKIVADGSNQGESGYQSKPYLGSAYRGAPDMTPEQIKEHIQWCQDNGWQIMVHANGDAAIDMTVKAFKEVLKDKPSNLRHRIEHCSLVADDSLFDTMAKLGVTPSFLINHVYFWGKSLRDKELGKDRIYMLDRTMAALKAGLKFTMHSDYNVSPINPLHYVKVAVTRTMWDGGEVLEPDQRVTVEQALRAVTIDAAWQMNAEDTLGSLKAGKHADLVILDRDPQKIEAEAIDQIKVIQTWRGGEVTYNNTSL